MVKDREAWRATVHGVAKSRARLNNNKVQNVEEALVCVVGFLRTTYLCLPAMPELLSLKGEGCSHPPGRSSVYRIPVYRKAHPKKVNNKKTDW